MASDYLLEIPPRVPALTARRFIHLCLTLSPYAPTQSLVSTSPAPPTYDALTFHHTVINVKGSRIVQFAHFSVKEFLTSDRLTTANEDLSRYHVATHLAHATLAQACIAVLLQLDDRIDKDGMKNFPLADYAARHWFEHGRFENVSLTIRDATKRLFDRKKPHFSAWVWIYDIDDPWREPMLTKHPKQPEAPPLYYAIHCRLRWLIEHLIATYPGDIQAIGGYFKSSWILAFEIGDVDVAQLLLRCGADVNAQDSKGDNPLHVASQRGQANLVRMLLDHNADVDLPARHNATPLALASSVGSSEISWLLIQRGANVNSRTSDDWTPLNIASDNGHLGVARLLLDNGADVDSPNDKGRTPLYSAASNGHLGTVKLLLESGADVNRHSNDGKTALDLAYDNKQLEVANFLSGHNSKAGARSLNDVPKLSTLTLQARNKSPNTVEPLPKSGEKVKPSDDEKPPLYTASENGQLDTVRSLLDRGADINEADNRRCTALYAASQKGKLEVAKLLIERGAYVNARSRGGWTPLIAASGAGHSEVALILLDHDADVDAKTRDGGTSLYSASGNGHLETVQLLLERGADVDIRDANGWNARQAAVIFGRHKIADILSEHGTALSNNSEA